ncbi:VWA domain-containing protein [Akkermansiaceae bacterium]|nr:VWA domain-containing protein [Akkermansiaceae bacterium]
MVLLMDASKSMGAVDSGGLSRMESAKLFARTLIDQRPTDRIGLLSFAGGAFPEVPSTLNRTMLLKRIDVLEPGSLRLPGTNLGHAFKSARELLTENPPPGSALVILSDGDNVTGNHKAIIETLKKDGIPVLAIAFGSATAPATVPNSPFQSQAEHEVLRGISQTTSGAFIEGLPSLVDSQIDALNKRIDAIELSGDDIAPELFDRPLDLYAYPLTAALILLMLHLFIPLRSKKWHPLSAIVAGFFFLSQTSEAQEPSLAYEEARSEATAAEKPLLLIFTGSDWSPLSITFEEEILSHEVYQKWEKKTVIPLVIDLPRTGIDAETRRVNRALASRFQIAAYPTAIFLEAKEETELGRLTHDDKGPASWVERADAILAGDISQGDSASSIDYLPEEVKEALEDDSLTEVERSIGYYNKALEIERSDEDLAIKSKDRFKLLQDLYGNAAESAPYDRPDLTFAARHKMAILHHKKSRTLVPEDMESMPPDEMMRLAQEADGDLIKLLKKARSGYRRALSLYRQAVPMKPGDTELSINLAVVYRDIDRVTAYIEYQEAYVQAVQDTMKALEQEKRFRKSLDYGVTTRKPINDSAVKSAAESIRDLVKKGDLVKDKPTILKEEDLDEYRLAEEDIDLAPAPHKERHLHPSVQHIQDALDHLFDPQQQQQPQQGEGDPGDGEPSEGEDEGPEGDRPDGEDEGEDEGNKGDSDADLRRSEKEDGDLRGRLLRELSDELSRENRGKPRVDDH